MLRKISPNVDSVFTDIQKHVMILSFRDTGDGSAGFSYVGSSSISNSVLSRGSTLSTRPSVEGRFSTAVAVSQSCGALRALNRPVARRPASRTHGEDVLVLASDGSDGTNGQALEAMRACPGGGQRTGGQGSGGAGLSLTVGTGARRAEGRVSGVDVTQKVWRRGLLEKGGRCCGLARLLSSKGLGCRAQSTIAGGPRCRTLTMFNFSQCTREGNRTRRRS